MKVSELLSVSPSLRATAMSARREATSGFGLIKLGRYLPSVFRPRICDAVSITLFSPRSSRPSGDQLARRYGLEAVGTRTFRMQYTSRVRLADVPHCVLML